MNRSLRAGVIVAALLVASPAVPAEVDETSLRNSNWRAQKEKEPDATPCNYLYLAGKTLLYYGTSGNCSQRISQHFTAMKSGYEVTEQVYRRLGEGNAVAAEVHNHLVTWTLGGEGQADTCLGIISTRTTPTVWYLPLTSKKNAAVVEACVLENAKGACNRKAKGSTRLSWAAFASTIQSCSK